MMILGFHIDLAIPAWTSFTLNGSRVAAASKPLWRLDPRLEAGHLSICDRLANAIDSSTTLTPLYAFGKFLNYLLVLLFWV